MQHTLSSLLIVALTTIGAAAQESANWTQWRGPLATGESPSGNPPVSWSETKNVRWKRALPGKGHSSPIVCGERIFLTSAEPFGGKFEPQYSGAPGAHDNVPVSQRHRFLVIAVDRTSGKIVWQQSVKETVPHEGGHHTGSQASASPVMDAQHVYASFGSHGLYCLDHGGKTVWTKTLGKMNTKHGHGEGASPALFGNTLVVNWDHEGGSFIVALDSATGEERWRVERDEPTSWTSPIIVEHAGQPQAIVCGTQRVRGYDLKSGQILWKCGGLSANVVATPIYADGMLFAASSYDTRALLAINLNGASGDLTDTDHVVWSRVHGTPYVPSPVLYRDALYFLRHYQGIMTRVDAKTGAERGDPMRLGEIRNVFASPVAAAGRIYITDLDGTTQVISHDQFPRVLSVNRLDDSFSASAAIVGDELFLRGEKNLYSLRATP
jgi:outer membrane protein assembly factor BamB